MKKIVVLTALLFSAALFAQEAGKDFYSADYKWTIKIPVGYTKAEFAPEDYDETEKLIFVVENGEEDYMEATDSPYDVAEDGDYAEMQGLIADMMKQGLERQLAEADITMVSKKETINGREFFHHDYTIVYPDDDLTLKIHLFNALFEGTKDFNMTISYIDQSEGDVLLTAWRASKFK
jgi:hypothetical protein